MLTFDEALERILEFPFSVESERIPLMEAAGRRLAAPVKAPWAMPRFDNSAMDGYAVRCADLSGAGTDQPVRFSVGGESAAGQPFVGEIISGTAIRISTGARLPHGADGIIPVEKTEAAGNEVILRDAPVSGRYIRRTGEDVRLGDNLLERGMRLTPARHSSLAMFNLPDVEVFRRPKVAILTSGEEVRPHGARLRDTDVVGVNIYYLEQCLNDFGCDAEIIGIAKDDKEDFLRLATQAVDSADVVISTAGVSVGEHDVVGAALKDMGAETIFWRVSVRPGKPMLFARVGEKPWFGLPGNPVSVVCNTEIFLLPFFRQAFGLTNPVPPRARMVLRKPVRPDRARLFFVPGRWDWEDGEARITPLPLASSANLLSAGMANGWIVLDPADQDIPAGKQVTVLTRDHIAAD